jgi:hypothetical protein
VSEEKLLDFYSIKINQKGPLSQLFFHTPGPESGISLPNMLLSLPSFHPEMALFRNRSLFLRFCSIGSAKSEPNLSANSANLFLREP